MKYAALLDALIISVFVTRFASLWVEKSLVRALQSGAELYAAQQRGVLRTGHLRVAAMLHDGMVEVIAAGGTQGVF